MVARAHPHPGSVGGDLKRPPNAQRVLTLAMVATGGYIVLLAIAGWKAHSLALLSEAGHNLSDFLALALSWVAVYIQTRPPSARRTYGYQRAGVLAAFVNALTLIGIAFYIFYEAGARLYRPQPVHPGLMMWVAAVGIVMNGVIALALLGSNRDVNLRSAFIHEIGDTVSTAAVLIGGFVIARTGQTWVDPALSFGIGALILWSSLGIMRETLNILLEGTPSGMELARIEAALRAVPGVNDVHDLHVWSLGSESHALSCHISIEDIPPSESERILRAIKEVLDRDFQIDHTTIQFENVVCEVAHGCVVPVRETDAASGHTH
ncbi:MAG: cation diffusion facilitator family transporter [Acidobacteriota bacterium]|nr:cation diffusion facilitator family transporter [Acidobacteriota bacterium]